MTGTLDQALHGLFNDMLRDPSVTASSIIMEFGRRAHRLGRGQAELGFGNMLAGSKSSRCDGCKAGLPLCIDANGTSINRYHMTTNGVSVPHIESAKGDT